MNPTTDLEVTNSECSLQAEGADAYNAELSLRFDTECRSEKTENPSENAAMYKHSGTRLTKQNCFPGLAVIEFCSCS